MRKVLGALFVVLAMTVVTVSAHAATWSVGDRAWVDWSGDAYLYPATVVTVDGSRYFVVYMDGDREWTTASKMSALNVTAGMRIESNWQNGGVYYSGKITAVNKDMIHIVYDDGDEEDTTIMNIRIPR